MSQQINLFNPIFLKQRKHFSATAMGQGLGLILLGAMMVVGYARLQLADLEANAAEARKQLMSTKAQLAKVSADYAPRQKSKALEDEVHRMDAELKLRQQAFEIVQSGGGGNSTGYAGYLHAFSRQVVNGLWLTGFTIEGNQIELRGRALQPDLVPMFINRLRQEPVMRGKSFARLAMEMPEVELAVSADAENAASAAKRRGPAGYIEFVLVSSDRVSDSPGEGGGLSGQMGGVVK